MAKLILHRGRFFDCGRRSGAEDGLSLSSPDRYALCLSVIRLHAAYRYCEGVVLTSAMSTPPEGAWCVREDGRIVGIGGDVTSCIGIVFSTSFVMRRHPPLLDDLVAARAAPR